MIVLLLLETVIRFPWLWVYVAQIYIDLSVQIHILFCRTVPTVEGLIEPSAITPGEAYLQNSVCPGVVVTSCEVCATRSCALRTRSNCFRFKHGQFLSQGFLIWECLFKSNLSTGKRSKTQYDHKTLRSKLRSQSYICCTQIHHIEISSGWQWQLDIFFNLRVFIKE